MPFLKVTRDARGYEHTYLLQDAVPGESPSLLYWFRSAPGVRVGRPAIDEEAIRRLEERHPELEFDWPEMLEQVSVTMPVPEMRVERPRRRPSRTTEPPVAPAREPRAPAGGSKGISAVAAVSTRPADQPSVAPASGSSLLEQLVGREIATRLRARYADARLRIAETAPDDETRRRWEARAQPLDPDAWLTAESVLRGVNAADAGFEALRRETS